MRDVGVGAILSGRGRARARVRVRVSVSACMCFLNPFAVCVSVCVSSGAWCLDCYRGARFGVQH